MPDPYIPPESIREELHRVLSHPEFRGTPRQRDFLRFVVLEALEGRKNEIKAYTVATQVFGRKPDFDSKLDPIVSVQAHHLRHALERYYLLEGRNNPVRIDIPKGTFLPTFYLRKAEEPHSDASGRVPTKITGSEDWPTVEVNLFRNLTGDRDQEYLAAGLTTELAVELSRYQDIRVLTPDPRVVGRKTRDAECRFSIQGTVLRDAAGIKVALQLVDQSTGMHVWAETMPSSLEASRLIIFQEDVARMVAGRLASEHGVISKTLTVASRAKPPFELTTYEAILRYYEFDRHVTVETYHRALEALEAAAANEPQCGQVWSLLGRMYGQNVAFEYVDLDTPLDKALAFAHKGVLLDPADQRARTIHAFLLMIANDLQAAKTEAERAHALNPNCLFTMDTIGYLLTHLGDWERGTALIERAMNLNPYYHVFVHFALWLNWFRQEAYQEAYAESLRFLSGYFWEPLAVATTLGHLGRHEEGQRAVAELLKLKPDFPRRGRKLIGYYIKFEKIFDLLEEGLHKVGLDLE
jgi:TolB-like protein/Flp pilus assembly protein TadD